MSLVEQERRGDVLVVTIRREEKRNAVDEEVIADLAARGVIGDRPARL